MKRSILICVVLLVSATGCRRVVPSLAAIQDVDRADFVRLWTGVAVDRPEEGSQRMTMTVRIDEPGFLSRWTATVGGDVVDNREQKVWGLRLKGNKLVFRLPAKRREIGPFWPMDIWLGLESEEKNKLVGVGLPIPALGWKEREDSFGIRLTRVP